jgi:hypothetical protein
MTICVDCKHHKVGRNADPQWYDHFCQASPLPSGIDFVTGQDLEYGTEYPYRYCQDVNQGDCALFEKRTYP